jgi:hypothetical protein
MKTINYMLNWLEYEKRKFVFLYPPGKAIDELPEVVFELHCKLMTDLSQLCDGLVNFLNCII